MYNGILPIGTVVKLKNMEKRVMIIGYGAKKIDEQDKIWDYIVCPFPYGVVNLQKTLVCNTEDIEVLYAIGYQDAEVLHYCREVAEGLKNNVKNEEIQKKEEPQ